MFKAGQIYSFKMLYGGSGFERDCVTFFSAEVVAVSADGALIKIRDAGEETIINTTSPAFISATPRRAAA